MLNSNHRRIMDGRLRAGTGKDLILNVVPYNAPSSVYWLNKHVSLSPCISPLEHDFYVAAPLLCPVGPDKLSQSPNVGNVSKSPVDSAVIVPTQITALRCRSGNVCGGTSCNCKEAHDDDEYDALHRPNENKMSDGGRGRAPLGVGVWKSS